MKLWVLFCSNEFCILKLISHKAVTSPFEDKVRKTQGNHDMGGSRVR